MSHATLVPVEAGYASAVIAGSSIILEWFLIKTTMMKPENPMYRKSAKLMDLTKQVVLVQRANPIATVTKTVDLKIPLNPSIFWCIL